MSGKAGNWAVLAAAAVLLATGLAGLRDTAEEAPSLPQSTDTTVARPLDGSARRIYILRELEGRVALFSPGEEIPFELTQIPVKSLPYQDQVSLRNGLVLRGEAELRPVLEDFGS